jgi:hypothetical protein
MCVRVHAQIVIFLYPPDMHQWTPPASSNPQVIAVGPPGVSQEGVMAATLTASHAGTATVTASARPMDGAPDPAAVSWSLTFTVTG